MEYFLWVFIALFAYSLIGPVVKIIEEDVPTETDVFITTAVMLLVTTVSILAFGSVSNLSLTLSSIFYATIGGVFLAVGVITFFQALRYGPVSVVVPIYGLFIVASSIIGMIFFSESHSVQKVVGILLSVVAIYLTSTSSS